jgi:hypothetical protein
MRIGYGWPKVFNTSVLGSGQETLDVGSIVGINNLNDHVLVVFELAAQLWSAGQVRAASCRIRLALTTWAAV